MKREDYIFTIGYNGDEAVVDKAARAKYGKMTTSGLIEAGQFKAAFCSALYSKDEEEKKEVLNAYNALSENGPRYTNPDDLIKVFGIIDIPEGNVKVKAL